MLFRSRNYENRVQLEKLCRAIHDVKPGILIGVDHEGGRVQRFREGFTEIPAMSAYGRAYKDDPEAAARSLTAAGFVMASELRIKNSETLFLRYRAGLLPDPVEQCRGSGMRCHEWGNS